MRGGYAWRRGMRGGYMWMRGLRGGYAWRLLGTLHDWALCMIGHFGMQSLQGMACHASLSCMACLSLQGMRLCRAWHAEMQQQQQQQQICMAAYASEQLVARHARRGGDPSARPRLVIAGLHDTIVQGLLGR